jgi:Kef-type K+ transport system membrane component KefB
MLDVELPVFAEMAVLVGFAALVGAIGLAIRQPLVVSFIVAGLLAGPGVLGLARSLDAIRLLADFGVAVLLFLVGLKLDVRMIRTLGKVATVTGLGQVFFTSMIGFALCLMLGFGSVESAYVAVALTFSSTIIIVKLLTDKREIDSLHGRVALGFLIVQDIVVVLAMVVLAATGVDAAKHGGGSLGALARGVIIVAAVLVVVRPLAERATSYLARSPELLVTSAIAWTLVLSAVGDWAGFGRELGGLLAGVVLGSTTSRDAIASRLAGLRDFLLLFFFLSLGATLEVEVLTSEVPSAVLLSLFVLIGNPVIVMILMAWLGFRARTGLLAGLTVAQISEFSLIFIAMGAQLGHVGSSVVGLVTLVGLITITGSTYMILYSHRLHAVLAPVLRVFEPRAAHREQAAGQEREDRVDVLLFGLGRYGAKIARRLRERGITIFAVDFDPHVVRTYRETEGVIAIYGDASDPELLAQLPSRPRAVVIALPPVRTAPGAVEPRAALTTELRRAFEAPIVVTAADEAEALRLVELGATAALQPFGDAAELAVQRIAELLAASELAATTSSGA